MLTTAFKFYYISIYKLSTELVHIKLPIFKMAFFVDLKTIIFFFALLRKHFLKIFHQFLKINHIFIVSLTLMSTSEYFLAPVSDLSIALHVFRSYTQKAQQFPLLTEFLFHFPTYQPLHLHNHVLLSHHSDSKTMGWKAACKISWQELDFKFNFFLAGWILIILA